jgi:aryl-alcohol dehydrogenase-like predicted oxidoreductase
MSINPTTINAAAAGTVALGKEFIVNRMGFGAMRITGQGIWGPPKDPAECRATLRRAIELGVNFIDTADAYGPAVSEELIAEALHPYPHGLVIGTKGGLVRPGPGRWDPDGRPEHLRQTLEGSLRRLRLECIDLYQFHRPDPKVPFEESVGTLADLRTAGKVRLIGLSNVTTAELAAAQEIVPIASVQNRYNFVDRDSEDVLDRCQTDGIAFIPWAPLSQGADLRLTELERVAEAKAARPAQIAIAWLLRRSPVMLVIPGTSRVEHLEENVAAAGIRLTDEEYERIGMA